MIWSSSFFVVYLFGVLSQVTARHEADDNSPAFQDAQSRSSERTKQVEIPQKVKENFRSLVHTIADTTTVSRTQNKRAGLPCFGQECISYADPSERGESRSVPHRKPKLNVSNKKERRFLNNLKKLSKKLAHKLREAQKNKTTPDRDGKTTDPGSWNPAPENEYGNLDLGVALLQSNSEGPICSGVHLKPWIIVTVGDCVSPWRPEDIYATVTMRQADGSLYQRNVEVESIELSPAFEPQKPENNLAIIQIFGEANWDVGYFELPAMDIPPGVIIFKRLETFTNAWTTTDNEDYYPSSVPSPVTLNYEICKSFPYFMRWYCVQNTGEVYTQIDVGGPFFFKSGGFKTLAGIYTGSHKNEPVGGHLFYIIQNDLDWLGTYVDNHPLPPDY